MNKLQVAFLASLGVVFVVGYACMTYSITQSYTNYDHTVIFSQTTHPYGLAVMFLPWVFVLTWRVALPIIRDDSE